MAIRRVTRWISDDGRKAILRDIDQYVNLLPKSRMGYSHCITIEYDDNEPIPEPTLVEAVGAFFSNENNIDRYTDAKREMRAALDREKQKSTR
jgi:hypothetical protein